MPPSLVHDMDSVESQARGMSPSLVHNTDSVESQAVGMSLSLVDNTDSVVSQAVGMSLSCERYGFREDRGFFAGGALEMETLDASSCSFSLGA